MLPVLLHSACAQVAFCLDTGCHDSWAWLNGSVGQTQLRQVLCWCNVSCQHACMLDVHDHDQLCCRDKSCRVLHSNLLLANDVCSHFHPVLAPDVQMDAVGGDAEFSIGRCSSKCSLPGPIDASALCHICMLPLTHWLSGGNIFQDSLRCSSQPAEYTACMSLHSIQA